MADGVLTSSLEPTWYKLFFGTLALPKNRGACVDAQKWHNRKSCFNLCQDYFKLMIGSHHEMDFFEKIKMDIKVV